MRESKGDVAPHRNRVCSQLFRQVRSKYGKGIAAQAAPDKNFSFLDAEFRSPVRIARFVIAVEFIGFVARGEQLPTLKLLRDLLIRQLRFGPAPITS